MTMVTKCVVDGCAWEKEHGGPSLSTDTLANVFGYGVMSAIQRDRDFRELEEAIERHLKTHSVLEWARTVRRLRNELDEIRR